MKKHIKNPKLVIAYYYEDLESDKMNADIFVADDAKDIDNQFLQYARRYCFWNIKKSQITEGDAGTYVQDEVEDSKGNKYKIILKPI